MFKTQLTKVTFFITFFRVVNDRIVFILDLTIRRIIRDCLAE